MSTLSPLHVEHLEWELRQCQDGIKNWIAALPCVAKFSSKCTFPQNPMPPPPRDLNTTALK